MKTISIITPIPDMINSIIEQSILRKAIEGDVVKFDLVDLRDYGMGNYKQIDDTPYGGGGGMILMAEPLFEALDQIIDNLKDGNNAKIIYPSPQGQLWSHNKAMENSDYNNLIFICGHYKDIDQRVIDKYVTNEYSIGDYVVTNGEVPAMIMIDSIVRLIPGVLNNFDSVKTDSFFSGIELDAPYYTRPSEIDDLAVPDVLLSGDHEKINKWRKNERRLRTKNKRPDLWSKRTKKLESLEDRS
ncbi:MAG: tRNA (guanosine(37)-N1)-methyltransferase TrmD [Candidatus Neomarinimicrobiota bacterium]|nr:tRNA (guanosine(37)-N1)-methyltransferase TrmD [Candidatus Neomarinimicrobiota bacterium]